MIEAMACGTPVIAFNRGSVPEVIEDGLTGFIVEDEAGAIGAVDRLPRLSRAGDPPALRGALHGAAHGEDYLAVYRSLIGKAAPRLERAAVVAGPPFADQVRSAAHDAITLEAACRSASIGAPRLSYSLGARFRHQRQASASPARRDARPEQRTRRCRRNGR